MRLVAALVPVAVFVALSSARGEVIVTRTEPKIARRTFDPKSPPADMPKLSGNEAAVTRSFYGADSRVGGEVVSTTQTASGTQATIKVDTVRITLHMNVTIWLPKNGNDKITNHEEGHRKIAEHYYEDAESIAKQLANDLIGQTVEATGRSPDDAANKALKQAANDLGKQYLSKTDTPCGVAQKAYDQITEHGTNAVKEDAAIKQAIQKADQSRN
jgi:hypothetical protein